MVNASGEVIKLEFTPRVFAGVRTGSRRKYG